MRDLVDELPICTLLESAGVKLESIGIDCSVEAAANEILKVATALVRDKVAERSFLATLQFLPGINHRVLAIACTHNANTAVTLHQIRTILIDRIRILADDNSRLHGHVESQALQP